MEEGDCPMLMNSSDSNTNAVVEREIPWIVNRVVVGCYKPASVLKELPGLDTLANAVFAGKTLRQLGTGQLDSEGSDVSGFFVVLDAGAAVLFEEKNNANKWANNVNVINVETAPSLKRVHSGHSSVSLHCKCKHIH